jgi:hypothetical protein
LVRRRHIGTLAILFVSIRAPGITLAITGPWEKYLG